MTKFVKGDIVIIPFPFSDLTQNKRCPALIISVLNGDDVILCQITSQNVQDNYAIQIKDKDFKTGELKQVSNIKPNRIFTADKHIVLYKAASLKDKKFNKVLDRLIEIIKNQISKKRCQTESRQERPLPGAPRTDPYVRNYLIRLLPWVSNAKPYCFSYPFQSA